MIEETQRKNEALRAENLSKRYAGAAAPALSGFDLRVREGEIMGLLGPNGAGKTTAISIMSTLLRPDGGKVFIGGVDALRHPGRARRLFGLVPQHIALYGRLSARENLRYFGRLYGLSGKTLARRVAECLSIAGLSDRADDAVATYSGGMKRRANLAAGLLHSPRLLFLDEPTVGIDAQSRNLILENLAALARAGTAMIYTTHYMEEAEALCGRVAVINGGQIIAGGPPRELMASRPGCRNLDELFLELTGRGIRD